MESPRRMDFPSLLLPRVSGGGGGGGGRGRGRKALAVRDLTHVGRTRSFEEQSRLVDPLGTLTLDLTGHTTEILRRPHLRVGP